MGYNVAQMQNIMWIDAVILLPLVALGIKNYVKKNFACLYLMTLVYLIICGWCLQASSKAQAIKVVCI